jgi:hypothetical protein
MDLFYKPNSNVLGDLVEKLEPSFEHSPERRIGEETGREDLKKLR